MYIFLLMPPLWGLESHIAGLRFSPFKELFFSVSRRLDDPTRRRRAAISTMSLDLMAAAAEEMMMMMRVGEGCYTAAASTFITVGGFDISPLAPWHVT